MTNAYLRFKKQNISHKILLLPGSTVEFGRDKSNDVKLALYPLEEISFQWATTDISRKHFVIERKNSQYTIKDDGSTNGTSVDCLAVLNRERSLDDKQILDVGGVLDLEISMRKNNMLLKRIGNTPQESYFLFYEDFTVGTSPESCIFIEKSVRNQATITYKNDQYFIKPSEENSNIYVNDKLIEYKKETPLNQEAKISMTNNNVFFEIILEKKNTF
ncbi:FHA domain-containing protein [Candidatus Uabimicrobium sp. HlEnr_7]|uniref:FHA domain-containing protein n=1 Tax=Candidatus Uabimicrobium helgolandensis TaxID=3095367 RepID=UPI003557174A